MTNTKIALHDVVLQMFYVQVDAVSETLPMIDVAKVGCVYACMCAYILLGVRACVCAGACAYGCVCALVCFVCVCVCVHVCVRV